MADRRPTPQPDPLERALQDLGRDLDWPASTNLASGIRARLAEQRPRRSIFSRLLTGSRTGRLAWAGVAAIVAVALVLAVSDSTRSVIADRIGVTGISISTDPTVTSTASETLRLGARVSMAEATALAGAIIPAPESILGPPDEVLLLDQDGTLQVTYVYSPRTDLPDVGGSGVGLLISQFAGNTNESFIQKQLGPATSIEIVNIAGQPGFWLSGEPHVFFYERPDGQIREESIRLAGNVLLWEQDGQTIRIESALDRDSAIRIAAAIAKAR